MNSKGKFVSNKLSTLREDQVIKWILKLHWLQKVNSEYKVPLSILESVFSKSVKIDLIKSEIQQQLNVSER